MPECGGSLPAAIFYYVLTVEELRLSPPPSPASYEHQFYDVMSGFTRLIIKTKYVCHGLISPYAKFDINLTM